MSNTVYKFKEICTKIGSGATPKGGKSSYCGGTISLIRSQNVHDFSFQHNGLAYINDEQAKKLDGVQVLSNDILLNIIGDSVARACIVDDVALPARVNQHVSIIRIKQEVALSEYVLNYLIMRKDYLLSLAKGGSTRNALTKEMIEELSIELPPIDEQKKIVSILKSIELKLHNNEKINDNLQRQLKLIYDYWFTQFDFPDENGKPYRSSGGAMVWNEQLKRDIPQNWTLGSISDCVEKISTGLNPRDNFVFGNGNIRYITVKNLTTSGSLDFSGCDMIDEEARALVHRRSDICIGDILFASIAPLGRCFLIQQEPSDWDINESVFSIRCKADMTTPEFLYLYFQSDGFIRKATNTSTGSIFKGIRINTLLDTKMIVPDLQVCKNFTNTIKPFLAEINNNSNETTQLIALRDWLLPLLMNGQVSFKDEQEERPRINDSGFEKWLASQGFAARGDVDMDVLRDIYEAMDNDDK